MTDEHASLIEQFWTGQGFAIERLASRWVFQQRDDFEQVIRLEFPARHAERIIAGHTSLEVDDDLLFLHRTFP